MSLLGEPLTSEKSYRHGMAGWSVADDELETRSWQILDQLLALPAPAVRTTKRLLASSLDRSMAAIRPRGSGIGKLRSHRRVRGRKHCAIVVLASATYLIRTARPRTSPRARASKACMASLNGYRTMSTSSRPARANSTSSTRSRRVPL